MTDHVLFSEADAAELLGVEQSTLRKWRLKGEGPEHTVYGNTKGGLIKYHLEDLESFQKVRSLANVQAIESQHLERKRQDVQREARRYTQSYGTQGALWFAEGRSLSWCRAHWAELIEDRVADLRLQVGNAVARVVASDELKKRLDKELSEGNLT